MTRKPDCDDDQHFLRRPEVPSTEEELMGQGMIKTKEEISGWLTITKGNSLPPKSSVDSLPVGESSSQSQAQGSKKAGNVRSSRKSYSTGTSNNTSDVSLNMASFIQKATPWIIVLTFPLCLLLSHYRHSLFNEQRSLSIWLASLGMFNFTAFLSSLFLMAISGAHFTRTQLSALVISAMVMNTDITGCPFPRFAPVLGILHAGSFA